MMSGKYNVKTLRPCVDGGFVIEAHFEKKILHGKRSAGSWRASPQCSEKLGVGTILPRGMHVPRCIEAGWIDDAPRRI